MFEPTPAKVAIVNGAVQFVDQKLDSTMCETMVSFVQDRDIDQNAFVANAMIVPDGKQGNNHPARQPEGFRRHRDQHYRPNNRDDRC